MHDDAMKPLDQIPDDDFERLLRRAVALPDAPPALLHRVRGLWPAASAGGALQAAVQTGGGRAELRQLGHAGRDRRRARAARGDAPPAVQRRGARHRSAHRADRRDVRAHRPGARARTRAARWNWRPRPARPSRRAAVDALGEFRIEDVGAGDYGVTLRLGGDEIVLPTLRVGASAM